ncbi:MAG: DUF1653 domain-containing protein [Candidatus Woesearchaeota archaeon]
MGPVKEVYKALYHSEEFGDSALWARPKSMFLENVTVKEEEKPRFRFLG